jgi:mono/diheme cytochrome c family protein
MNLPRHGLLGIVLLCLTAGSSSLALQTRARNVTDGVYTDQQATRGQGLYRARCASCHGDALTGRSGPPLAGTDFVATWNKDPLLDLANKIRRTMPRNETSQTDGPGGRGCSGLYSSGRQVSERTC